MTLLCRIVWAYKKTAIVLNVIHLVQTMEHKLNDHVKVTVGLYNSITQHSTTSDWNISIVVAAMLLSFGATGLHLL